MSPLKGADIIAALQADILRLQGFNAAATTNGNIELGPILEAFPNRTFPIGAVHEFLSARIEDTAATCGFIAAMLASLMGTNGVSLWIGSSRKLFPPALKNLGVEPHRFIFIDANKEKDVIWAIEEALKCAALTAVVGELHELSFTNSRRLQLAVEQSQVTGFILRSKSRIVNTTACVSRWQITPLVSEPIDDLPGIGFPRWRVELLRIRNGKPGVWNMQYTNGKCIPVYTSPFITHHQQQKAG